MAGVIRVVIVDDHPATAEGLAAVLSREADIDVVGVAGDLGFALRLVAATAPDVVLCDIQMNGEPSGFDILPMLGADRPPAVLFISSFDYPAFQQRALELGARGYLLKSSGVRDIVAAVRSVAAGGTAFTAAALRSRQAGPAPSERELELVGLIRAGLSNDEAAVRLGIGTRGIESSLRRMFQRYGVMSRTELVTFTEEQGWLAFRR